jgi:undecaprenyl diphosphate synthase
MKNIPEHLGIIIDGNRRWARKRRLPTLEGHRQGYINLKKIGKLCRKRGIKILTIFVFSTENWNRSKEELSYLFRLLTQAFSKREIAELDKEGIRLKVIGHKEKLDKNLQRLIQKAEERTKNNKDGILNLAISYDGRSDIIEAIKKIIKKKIKPEKITHDLVSKNLWTEGLQDPDLIIRTSGELRMSGFLTWQSVYSELYFSNKLWPDFNEKDLDLALSDYVKRQRRFGK